MMNKECFGTYKSKSFLIVVALLISISCNNLHTLVGSKPTSGTGMNLVLDRDFADPTVIKVGNKYYAYATQSRNNGKTINIQVASSFDHQQWKYEGDALPQKPKWASNTQNFWAPDVFFDAKLKKFVMFFSADPDGLTGKCLGVAYADNPLGPFTDKGEPLLCGSGFQNIDPKGFTDPKSGKHLLYWGSDFQPLKVQEMTDDWSAFKPGTKPKPIVYPGKDKTYSNLIEGSWLDYNKGIYYLYYSGDNCCGEKANYAVMIARASNPLGPFERLGEVNRSLNSTILEKDSVYLAPGHNSIFKDEKGKKWIAYHAIERSHKEKGRVMCINRITYKNGWPVVLK